MMTGCCCSKASPIDGNTSAFKSMSSYVFHTRQPFSHMGAPAVIFFRPGARYSARYGTLQQSRPCRWFHRTPNRESAVTNERAPACLPLIRAVAILLRDGRAVRGAGVFLMISLSLIGDPPLSHLKLEPWHGQPVSSPRGSHIPEKRFPYYKERYVSHT